MKSRKSDNDNPSVPDITHSRYIFEKNMLNEIKQQIIVPATTQWWVTQIELLKWKFPRVCGYEQAFAKDEITARFRHVVDWTRVSNKVSSNDSSTIVRG